MDLKTRIAAGFVAILVVQGATVNAGVKKFGVLIDQQCIVIVGDQRQKASKLARDKVEWSFENKCASARNVLLFPKSDDPLTNCNGKVAKYKEPFVLGKAGSPTRKGSVTCDVTFDDVLSDNPACIPGDNCRVFQFDVIALPIGGLAEAAPAFAPPTPAELLEKCRAAGIPAEKCLHELGLEVVP